MQRRMKRYLLAPALILAAASALAACGSGFGDSASSTTASGGATALTSDASKGLTIMIGSSGDAETKAVTSAVAAWSAQSGVTAKVVVASNLTQQLAQGFAARRPADLFYVTPDYLAGYAANGSVLAYGDRLSNKSDFYPNVAASFTLGGELYCAPKDFSTLQLIVNTDMWRAAGLTDADYPTTWAELEAVSARLTTSKHVGLAFSGEYARIGAFMVQAGGNLMNADSSQATADSAANVTALTEVKKLLASGTVKYAKDLGAGWGGEAFGKGQAAMTIEGNWITGSLATDYPSLKYKVVELPAGTAGKGTLQFSTCWGLAADSPDQADAVKLVEYLTTTRQQLAFATAYGVMPSVRSAATQWKTDNPALTAFLAGADYARGVPAAQGASDVVTDFNAKLETLKSRDPATLLAAVQKNLEAL